MRRIGTFLAACLLLAPAGAAAITVGAMPAYLVVDSAAGTSSQEEVTVMNGSDAPLVFAPRVRDLGIDASGREIIASAGTLPTSAAAWISFVPKQLEVPPRSSGKFKVIISVPPNAAGGHYALLDFETAVDLSVTKGAGVRVGAGVSVKLLHSVSGRTSPKMQVAIARFQPPTASDRMDATLQFVNRGDVHVRPTAAMLLLDANRKVVGRTEQEGGGILLPGQPGSMRLTWGGELAAGEYLGVITIVLGTDSQVIERRFTVGPPAIEARAGTPRRK